MVLRFFFALSFFLFFGCAQVERDSPFDPDGKNYKGDSSNSNTPPSSSSMENVDSSSSGISTVPSSSSIMPSSSSIIIESCDDFVEGTEREHYGKSKPQFCDERDGKKYVYTKIGEQIWMAENLNYNAIGSTCCNKDPATCPKYGRFYNWTTAMDDAASSNANPSGVKGVCPTGWHLPSMAEWNALKTYVESDKGCTSCAAKHLKAQIGWESCGTSGEDSSYPCNDSFGFAALPNCALALTIGTTQKDYSKDGDWWSSTKDEGFVASANHLYVSYSKNYTSISRETRDFCSVRCVKD